MSIFLKFYITNAATIIHIYLQYMTRNTDLNSMQKTHNLEASTNNWYTSHNVRKGPEVAHWYPSTLSLSFHASLVTFWRYRRQVCVCVPLKYEAMWRSRMKQWNYQLQESVFIWNQSNSLSINYLLFMVIHMFLFTSKYPSLAVLTNYILNLSCLRLLLFPFLCQHLSMYPIYYINTSSFCSGRYLLWLRRGWQQWGTGKVGSPHTEAWGIPCSSPLRWHHHSQLLDVSRGR